MLDIEFEGSGGEASDGGNEESGVTTVVFFTDEHVEYELLPNSWTDSGVI